ncbi:MAG: Gx transporter family protein [Gammaproteobacteria bacterium]|nr:Gx transporter family protein [Gammaproteobacteria bacterium]
MIMKTTRDDHRIAWLTGLAILIHMLESTLPSPLPGVKPGLANVITLIVLMMYGWSAACWVTLLRILVGSLLLGTFLSPTFLLSLSGALTMLAAAATTRLAPAAFGPIGLSVLMAIAHIAGQFAVAYTLFIPHQGLFSLLPLLMTAAVAFGLINGLISQAVLRRLGHPTTALDPARREHP